MIQLNLLPDVKKEFLRAKAMRRNAISLSIIITMVSAGILVILVLMLGAQKLAISSATNNIKEKSTELADIPNISEYLTVQAQLAQIDGLHGSKLNISRLLDVLPRLNPADPNSVRFASVNVATETSTVEFQGGVRNVSALTTFKDTLKNAEISYRIGDAEPTKEPLFSSVTITEYGFSANTEDKNTAVGFTIVVEYNPALFATTTQRMTVSVPKIETTQSVEGSPKVIFEKDAGSLEKNR